MNTRYILPLLFPGLLLLSCNQQEQPADTDQISEDPFADHVRKTEFQTPEQELAMFTVPEGFEVTLFAAEPDITKPINMEFDVQGRLWVTQSEAYPMAAAPLEGKDRITILEDTDGDGKADVFTPFAADLNIPIGILPVSNGAIAFSIPAVSHYIDSNRDGHADTAKKLLGPFGYRDTHGMVNNFIRGFDGWIHASHGFTNTSTIAGADGDSITMTSGNTFRFRDDGSRVEQTTFGRVNPFGYAFDEFGYLYSVDCHSKPIYQLIERGDYPHFGKRAPAIGFAPEMMNYELGSTALAGLAYYTADQFPEEYRNSFYNGDVVTCRVNRNTMNFHGSTPEAVRQEDFLVSKDPWFRPVDVKVGPDGALYIADFYNRIIGHYEVPLDHPGRDRTSGRIWKITYTGTKKNSGSTPRDWSSASLEELIQALNHPVINTRLNIASLIVDRFGAEAVQPLSAVLRANTDPKISVQALWILSRLNALSKEQLHTALTSDNELIQVHALRILGEAKSLSDEHRNIVVQTVKDPRPRVKRMGTALLAEFPHVGNVKTLLEIYHTADPKDSHLKYTALSGIRDQFTQSSVIRSVAEEKYTAEDRELLARAAIDIPSVETAGYALNYLQNAEPNTDLTSRILSHIGRHLNPSRYAALLNRIRDRYKGDIDAQLSFFNALQEGITQRGAGDFPALRSWATELSTVILRGEKAAPGWITYAVDNSGEDRNPWRVFNRQRHEDFPDAMNISSDAHGQNPKGILRTSTFVLPEYLSLSVFDNHIDNTDAKAGKSDNAVRIRLTDGRLISVYRHEMQQPGRPYDINRMVRFDLRNYAGREGYLEVVDSSRIGSIAIGKGAHEALNIPQTSPLNYSDRVQQGAAIAGRYGVQQAVPLLREIVQDKQADTWIRIAAAENLLRITRTDNLELVGRVFLDPQSHDFLKGRLGEFIARLPGNEKYTILRAGLTDASRRTQRFIVNGLTGSPEGIQFILRSAETGDIAAAVLTDRQIDQRLREKLNPADTERLNGLTAGVARDQEQRNKIIRERLDQLDIKTAALKEGESIFIQNCALCHQVAGKGGLVGPQLDGIGNWGAQALTEKILDPNRNVSEAFRNYSITLNDGRQLSGLYRRKDGEALIFADITGKEFSVAENTIRERKLLPYTLMPDHFAEILSQEEYNALMKYLLNIKG